MPLPSPKFFKLNATLQKIKALEGDYFTHTKSKAGQWLNYKLLKAEEGEVEVSIQVREEMTNPNGMLHGGMIGMICDELCGLAFYTKGFSTFYTTVNLAIDFLYSAPIHATIIGKARVIRSGKKIANTECTLYDEQGIVVAHASSNLVNTEKAVFDLHLPIQK
jgi:acyl-coenzyme A thioesterase 13